MKPMIRILSLSALVLVALVAALYFALPSNRLNISFPNAAEPGIGTPDPLGSSSSDQIAAPVLTATAGANQITVSWQAIAGAASYELWGRTGEGAWIQVDGGALTGSATSFTHTQLTAGAVYYYTGRAVPSSGDKSAWAVQTSATVLDASGVPSLTASPAIGMIELSWSAVAGTDNYHLISWTDGQEDWERIGDPITGTITSFVHSGLTPGTTYHYRVRAVIAGTEGDWSDSISAVPTVPAAPILTATAATGQVQLSWSAVTGADSYHLILHTEGIEDWNRIGDPITGTATSFTHTGLIAEQSYFYKLRAVVDGIEGEWSSPIAAIPTLPAAPTLAAASAAGQVQLSWNQVTGADSYHLIVWTSAQNAWQRIGDPLIAATTAYTHTALSETAIYYYRISAVAGGAAGNWSNTISAVPATSSIPGLVATAAAGQVELSWSAVSGAEGYHLITWREGKSDWTRLGDPLAGGTTSYTHSSSTAGVTYYYRVRAVVNGANGEWSEQIDITP